VFVAAVQAFFTYSETCGKTLEEIELLFREDRSKACKTKPGGSRIDTEIAAVIERKAGGRGVYENRLGDEGMGSEETDIRVVNLEE